MGDVLRNLINNIVDTFHMVRGHKNARSVIVESCRRTKLFLSHCAGAMGLDVAREEGLRGGGDCRKREYTHGYYQGLLVISEIGGDNLCPCAG